MSQHDHDLSDAAGTVFRADINAALVAEATLASGATTPSVTFPYMWWADTTTGLLKMRNSANTQWVPVGVMSAANLGITAQPSRPVTQVNSNSYTLLDSDNGKAFVFSQSCALLFPQPNSLTVGWNVALYNLAPSSLSPVICTASKWDGDGTELHLQAWAGANKLEVTFINSVFFTSRRRFLTETMADTHKINSFHTVFHGLAATPRAAYLHLTNVASENGYDRERLIYAIEQVNGQAIGGYGALVTPNVTSFGLRTGIQGFLILDRSSVPYTAQGVNNAIRWNTRLVVSF